MRVRAAVLFGVLALAVAGCGGGGSGSKSGSGGGGSGSPPAGAEAVPATAPVFGSLSTDFSGSQWTQALALAHLFPGFDALLAQGRQALTKRGLDFEQDVKPALGTEADLSFLDLKSSNDFVFLTNPQDKAKFDALLTKGGSSTKPAKADVGAFVVLGKTQASVSAATGASGHLSETASFKDAMAALPGEALLRAYVDGPAVQAAIQQQISKSGTTLPIPKSTSVKLDWLAAALSAQTSGVRLDAAAKVEPQPKLSTYSAELPSSFPEGALAYISFSGLDGVLRQVIQLAGKSSPTFQKQLSQVEAVAGFSLDKDVIPIFKNEAGIAVYPSTEKIPTIVFAVKVDDEQKTQQILDKLGALAQASGNGSLKPATVDGFPNAKELTVGTISVFYGVAGGKLVTSNRIEGLTGISGSGAKLADDAVFKAVKDGAGMPADTSGFVYANLKAGLPLLLGYAERSGRTISPSVRANLAPLESALFYATEDGDLIKVSGFAAIK